MLQLGNNLSLYAEEGLLFMAVEGDMQLRLLSANKAFLALTGKRESEIVGKLLQQALPEPERGKMVEHCRRAIREKTSIRWEVEFQSQEGKRVKTMAVMPIFDEKGRCNFFIGTAHDITERKKTEAALRDETRILELLNETGSALASTLDLQTLLQRVTDSATQLTGANFGAFFYNTTDAQGDSMTLYTLSGAPREAFDQFGHPRSTPVFCPTLTEATIVRSDDITQDPRYGKWAPHHGMPLKHLPVRSYLAVPVISRSGESAGSLLFGHPDAGIFTERTERLVVGLAAQAAIAIDNARLYEVAQKAAEEREVLLQSERGARAEAERLSDAKDEFLAMLAHELRNPLAPINNAAELLSGLDRAEPLVRQASERILRQVVHISRIMDDLLDVSRVTRGLVTVSKEAVDFNTVISGALDQVHPLIEEKGHQVTVHAPYQPVYVEGDETRLVQAVANVLNNAVKYTPEGGKIDLTLEVTPGALQLRVQDNGSGMPADLVPEVFEMFTQGKRTLARSQGGLGLGLTLVKALVELHGGSVIAESEGVGKGSEFVIDLPALQFTVVERVPTGPKPATAMKLPAPNAALNIMVIDDNVDAAETTADLLRTEGHNVSVEYTGQGALDRAFKESNHVFLVDIGLPDMDGYELVKRLRTCPHTAKAVFVAVTGYGQPKDRERTAAAGFARHLVKPAKIATLMALIAEIAQTNV